MRRAMLVGLLLAVVTAVPAVAQEDGVFVDPDSPAGKEYAVPLDQARREAAGGGSRGSAPEGGAEAEALFGAGIERVRRASTSVEHARGSGGRVGWRGGAAKPAQRGSPGSDAILPSNQSVAAIEAAAGGGSDVLLTAGIAAVVLAAGLLAGLGLRRALKRP